MAHTFQVTIDSTAPHPLADWWAEALGWQAKVGIAERADRLVSILVITGVADLLRVLGVDDRVLYAIPVTLGALAVASTITVVQRIRVVHQQAVAEAASGESAA